MDTIILWKAIKEMRQLSELNKPFSFSYHRVDDGVRVDVDAALLRKRATNDVNFEHKLSYYDIVNKKDRQCFQILIVEFNGKKCTL